MTKNDGFNKIDKKVIPIFAELYVYLQMKKIFTVRVA